MKKTLLTTVVAIGAMPSMVMAGIAYTNPTVDASGSGDSNAAIILLALVGAVIVSSQIGGMATRNANEMRPDEPLDE